MPKCPPTGGVRLQEVSVSGGSTVFIYFVIFVNFFLSEHNVVQARAFLSTVFDLKVETFKTIL